jgi:hypothetical protein
MEKGPLKKNRFIFGVLALLAFMCAAGVPGLHAAAEDEVLIWTGSASDQKEEFTKVVDTREEWSALWKRAFDRPAPAVDFKKYVVACVFLGHGAGWLYSIGFDKPYRRGNDWIIPYGLQPLILELARPFKASGQYRLQVYERIPGGRMILEEDASGSRRL